MLVIKQVGRGGPFQESMPRLRPHVGIISTSRGQLVTALAKPGKQSSDILVSLSPPPSSFTALGEVEKDFIRSKELPADRPLCLILKPGAKASRDVARQVTQHHLPPHPMFLSNSLSLHLSHLYHSTPSTWGCPTLRDCHLLEGRYPFFTPHFSLQCLALAQTGDNQAPREESKVDSK